MTDMSKTFNVITDDCDEVIFHKISLGAFHTSMFTRTVATTKVISCLTGEIHNKNKATFLKSTLPYHLESKTHIYHASERGQFWFSSGWAPLMIANKRGPPLQSLINMGNLLPFKVSILSGMWASVVFRSAIGLPRSADTEVGALINKPKQNWKKIKNNGHRKHFYHVFQMGKKTH